MILSLGSQGSTGRIAERSLYSYRGEPTMLSGHIPVSWSSDSGRRRPRVSLIRRPISMTSGWLTPIDRINGISTWRQFSLRQSKNMVITTRKSRYNLTAGLHQQLNDISIQSSLTVSTLSSWRLGRTTRNLQKRWRIDPRLKLSWLLTTCSRW